MPEHQALPVEDTLAYVMDRNPVREHEGMWLLIDRPWEWLPIDYVPSNQCEHWRTMCPSCQESWFQYHNILLISRHDPKIRTDFDALVRTFNKERGISERPLSDFQQ